MSTRFEVTPAVLSAQASSYDDVAVTIGRIRASVRAAGVPSTGRADTTEQLASVLDALLRGLDQLGEAAVADADDLRRAAVGYLLADRSAMRVG